jgi:predicted site-specific integrase-resolvase
MPQPIVMKKPAMPQLVNTRKAAEILGRSAATLKRWRAEGVGHNWIELQGRVSYDVNVLLEYIEKNTRVAFRAGCNGGSS